MLKQSSKLLSRLALPSALGRRRREDVGAEAAGRLHEAARQRNEGELRGRPCGHSDHVQVKGGWGNQVKNLVQGYSMDKRLCHQAQKVKQKKWLKSSWIWPYFGGKFESGHKGESASKLARFKFHSKKYAKIGHIKLNSLFWLHLSALMDNRWFRISVCSLFVQISNTVFLVFFDITLLKNQKGVMSPLMFVTKTNYFKVILLTGC